MGTLAVSSNLTVMLIDSMSPVVMSITNDCTMDVMLSVDVAVGTVNNDLYDRITSAIITSYGGK